MQVHPGAKTPFSIIKRFGFKENVEDNSVYVKFKSGKYIFLILYVDDILLASSDVSLLIETKKFLSSNFDMKDHMFRA